MAFIASWTFFSYFWHSLSIFRFSWIFFQMMFNSILHFFSKVTSSPIGEYEFTVVLLTNCRDDMKIPSSTVSPFLVENELRANHCLFSPKPLSICFIERRWVLAGILCVVEAELVDLQGRNICLLQPLPLLNLSSYTFQSEGPTFFPGRDINL